MIIMLKRLQPIKLGLQNMVIGEEWSSCRGDNVSKATKVKEIILNDSWWGQIDHTLSFTTPSMDCIHQLTCSLLGVWDTGYNDWKGEGNHLQAWSEINRG